MIVPYYDDTMDLKKFVQDIGLLDIYVAFAHYQYFVYMVEFTANDSMPYEMPLSYTPYESFKFFAETYPSLWDICRKIYNSRRAKVSRIKKRLQKMLLFSKCKNFLFLTLTFRDNVFESTSVKTRRVYARRYLTSLDCSYVANIDFGGRFGREHYHCIVAKEKVDYKDWFKYGAINFEKISNLEKDITKIAPYIDKLANHCVKDRAGSIIYSRDLARNRSSSCFILLDDSDFPF